MSALDGEGMKRGSRILGLGMALAAMAVSLTGAEGSRADAVERAKRALDRLQSAGFAGTVLVACGDQILLHQHYGLELAADQTPSYWIASITKQFTAAAVLRLITESELTLETKLGSLFEQVPEDKADITVHQLLSHQSGLPQAFASAGITDRDEALAAILELPLELPPGSGFRYSNDGYTLLAIIVDAVSGASYEAYLQASVIEPAGLRHAASWPQLARGGEVIPPLVNPLPADAYAANWDFRGAVGMRLSIADLHRWVLALDRHEVLNQRQLEQLLGPHVTTRSGLEVGYNWFWEATDEARNMLWTRGQEQFGANAVVYLFPGTDLFIAAATHAGPAETGSGPVTGWSRAARDLMIETFDPNPCTGRQSLFAGAEPRGFRATTPRRPAEHR